MDGDGFGRVTGALCRLSGHGTRLQRACGSAVRVPVAGGRGALRDHHRAPPHDIARHRSPGHARRHGGLDVVRLYVERSPYRPRLHVGVRRVLPCRANGCQVVLEVALGSGCACRVCRAPAVVRCANPRQHRACVRRAVAALSPASRAAVGVRLACRRDHGRVLLFRGGVLRGGRRSRVVHRSPHDRPPADSGRPLRDVRPDDGGRAHGGAESRASAAAGLGRRRDADCEPRVAALPRIGRRRA